MHGVGGQVAEARWLIWAVEGWLLAGFAVAVPFVLFGLTRVDPDARGSWTFRPLLIPGVAALWPLVLWWWIRGRSWAGETS